MNFINAHFSPGGSTQVITKYFTSCLAGEPGLSLDLLRDGTRTVPNFSSKDLLVVGMPVFAGRLPQVCPAMLDKFKGDNTPAVALVAYGNREYEDALLELCDILSARGFKVIGAGAFIARHSIFPKVAAGRPDDTDKQKIAAFAANCAAKLAAGGAALDLSQIRGDRPYRDIPPIPLKPSADDACNACGICSEICPTHAINPATPRETDAGRCISCTACIYNCPQDARSFRGPGYEQGAAAFLANFSARREPEVFV